MSPLMRSHCYLVATLKSQPVVMVASCKANARPCSQDQEHSLLNVLASTFGLGERELWSFSKLSPRLVFGSVYPLARKASTSCAWRFYVQVAWYFYVHFLRIASTCTSTCALHDKPRFDWEDNFNFIVYVIHTMNFDIPSPGWRLALILFHFCIFLFASLSEMLAISILEPFWKSRDFYSRAILKSSRSLFARFFFVRSVFLFASLSEKLAISTREPFWKARDIHSRAFSLCAAFFYSRAILKSSRSLFVRLSLCAALSY